MHLDLLLKNISDVHSDGTGSVSEMKSQHLTCHNCTMTSLLPPSLCFFSHIKVPKTYVFLRGIWMAKLKCEASIWRINHLNETDDRVVIFTLECTKWPLLSMDKLGTGTAANSSLMKNWLTYGYLKLSWLSHVPMSSTIFHSTNGARLRAAVCSL